MKYTIDDFNVRFPDDDTCLEYLKNKLYPDGIYCKICGKITKHHKVKSRPSYSCDYCGHHVHPTADTIFHRSRTSLRQWFYAIYLMSATRCGISAKQLQRELGVTYKTAWRMFQQIRSMLYQSPQKRDGVFEADETYVGGKPPKTPSKEKRGYWSKKTPVVAIIQRHGGIQVQPIANVTAKTLRKAINATVDKKYARLCTDELGSYTSIGWEFNHGHGRVNHQRLQYSNGPDHVNTCESFFAILKRGLYGKL